MTFDQIFTIVVLIGVLSAFILDKGRAEVVALSGAAALLLTGVVEPSQVQRAFGSPALITLASLFMLTAALERTGVLGWLIEGAARLALKWGKRTFFLVFGAVGVSSSFVNNTPVVVISAPLVRDMAHALKLPPTRVLIPLSYVSIMAGTCTLIGTSTNLLVDDMADAAGVRRFGLFEITPVGLVMAAAGLVYLALVGWRLLPARDPEPEEEVKPPHYDLDRRKGAIAIGAFAAVIVLATLDVAPIAALAFAAAISVILLRVITPEEAYRGLKPEILLLIAGMLVIGLAMESSGLAAALVRDLAVVAQPFGPWVVLAALYLLVSILTEILSNAGVAVLVTPLAVAMAYSLGVDPRPFVVAVMMGASASFATPFGYQTNAVVHALGRYRYTDFLKVGVPLNLLTWVVATLTIPRFFPFQP